MSRSRVGHCPLQHRQRVDIDNKVFPLRTVPAKGLDPMRFDSFVDRLSPDAIVPQVYVDQQWGGMCPLLIMSLWWYVPSLMLLCLKCMLLKSGPLT